MNPILNTSTYSTSANSYMRTVAEVWLGRWWWCLIIPVASCFALAATVNVAFTFVGFMILFLIVPTVVMFLYFAHALTAEARMAVLRHRVSVSSDEIVVDFEPDELTGNEYEPVHIGIREIVGVECRSHDLMLHLSGSQYRFLLIPYDAIGSDSAIAAMTARLNDMAVSSAIDRTTTSSKLKLT
ncbi:MAG: hypothetical protein K2L49_08145 [Muribaculaceae bacterium]|nr:hypothetical protein [Muribaculaceae bacterium]